MTTQTIQLSESQIDGIFKNYKAKIEPKLNRLTTVKSEDINNLVIFLNWCFVHKNNFFIPDFNKKSVYSICQTYNQLKTNILSENTLDLLTNITPSNIKTLKFILHSFITNYDSHILNTFNTKLCQTVTKESLKNCIFFINSYQN